MQEELGIDDAVIHLCREWNNWLGSHYELALRFDPGAFDHHARSRLLQYVWRYPSLLGVVEVPDDFGHPWLDNHTLSSEDSQHYYGCIRLSEKDIIGCASVMYEAGDGLWFVFYITFGMIHIRYPVDYDASISSEGDPWTIKMDEVLASIKLDEMLASIGHYVYQEFPFMLGAIGEEAAGVPIGERMAELASASDLLVPESLFQRLGVTPHGLRFPEGLWWTGSKERAAQTY